MRRSGVFWTGVAVCTSIAMMCTINAGNLAMGMASGVDDTACFQWDEFDCCTIAGTVTQCGPNEEDIEWPCPGLIILDDTVGTLYLARQSGWTEPPTTLQGWGECRYYEAFCGEVAGTCTYNMEAPIVRSCPDFTQPTAPYDCFVDDPQEP